MKRLLLALSLVFATSSASASGGVEVSDAWIREAPPTMEMLAAYLELENHGDKAFSLTHADSPAFEKIEIHRSEEHNGMMHMSKQAEVAVPAHGKVSFAPGGLHLMLIRPKHPIKAGDDIHITLHFRNGDSLMVMARVRRDMGGHHEGHGDHGMQGMQQEHQMQHDDHGSQHQH